MLECRKVTLYDRDKVTLGSRKVTLRSRKVTVGLRNVTLGSREVRLKSTKVIGHDKNEGGHAMG